MTTNARFSLSMCLVAMVFLIRCAPSQTANGAVQEASQPMVEQQEERALGDGFAVWESNRTGSWRIWQRSFDRSPPRQLSPDEGDLQHCCVHLSPNGERLVYLSLPRGQERYPATGAAGTMHLMRSDGSAGRVIVAAARTYFEHRAAVWVDDNRLIYISAPGETRLLDLESGEEQVLLRGPTSQEGGWLVNRTLTHATTGRPTFSRFDASAGKLVEQKLFGGCQPYFSHDGRWGYWIAGAGGPLRRIDLATRAVSTMLAKNDSRLSLSHRYVYFPMLSRDGQWLSFAASEGEHDHIKANYDIFVVETDPETLEVLGSAVRLTTHPASDRFPDVYGVPLALGRHFGEAQLRLRLAAPTAGDWSWTLGDGSEASGGAVEHVYAEPGFYEIEARLGEQVERGSVRVRAARPPRLVRAAFVDETRMELIFDEELAAVGEAQARLRSGAAVADWEIAADGRRLLVDLAEPALGAQELQLIGFGDRASPPNLLPQDGYTVAPRRWPARRDGLLFLWRTGDAANQLGERVITLEPKGRAWLDRHYAMTLRGGSFVVTDQATVERVFAGARESQEFTVEATITPLASVAAPGGVPIVNFSGSVRSRNFTLGQKGDRLFVRIRTPTTGENADQPEVDLGPLALAQPNHVVVSYTPGRLVYYLDGEKRFDSDVLQGGFFHWKLRPLLFGNAWQAARPWLGTLEGVAIYDRFIEPPEAAESFRRYAAILAARRPVAATRLRGRLVARAEIPTLQQIAPYDQALAIFEYAVEEVLAGEHAPATIRVAHRVLVDGETLPIARRAVGKRRELVVEPFAQHPQLESLYLSTLPADPSLRLYFSEDIDP